MSVPETVTAPTAPTADEVKNAHEKMITFFTEGFKEELKSHLDENHTYMYGKSLYKLTEAHEIPKQLGIFVLMGSNRRHEEWGTLKEKYDMEPVSKVLTSKLVEIAREVAGGYYYHVIFTDRDYNKHNNGNFKLKIDMKPLPKKNSSRRTTDDEDGFKKVESRQTKARSRSPADIDRIMQENAILKAQNEALKLTVENRNLKNKAKRESA